MTEMHRGRARPDSGRKCPKVKHSVSSTSCQTSHKITSHADPVSLSHSFLIATILMFPMPAPMSLCQS
jgi:hypothetical protein